MISEHELNEKLAKWAGFQEQTNRWHFEFTKKVLDWLFPTPSCHIGKLPNFTQSLDACFEWLVPEVIDMIMAEQECSSDLAYAILFKKWLQELELDIPNYAPTLCLAIEKLIDSEAKK